MSDYPIVVKLVDQTRAALRSIETGLQGIQTRADAANKAVAGLGSGLARAGAVAGAALSLAAKSALTYADSVQDASDATGIGTARILAFSQAVAQNGGNSEKAIQALVKFNETIGDAASQSQTARDALAAVGVSLSDIANKSVEENLGTVVKTLAGITSESERASKQAAVFGKTLKGTNVAGFGKELDALTAKQKTNADAVRSGAQLVDTLKAAYTRLELSILRTIKPLADFINSLSEEQLDRAVTAIASLGAGLLAVGTALGVFAVVAKVIGLAGIAVGGFYAALKLALAQITFGAGTLKYLGEAIAVAAKNSRTLAVFVTTLGGAFAGGLGGVALKAAGFLLLGLGKIVAIIGIFAAALVPLLALLDLVFSTKTLDVYLGKLKAVYDWTRDLLGLSKDVPAAAATPAAAGGVKPPKPGGTPVADLILKPFYESIAQAREEYDKFLKLINKRLEYILDIEDIPYLPIDFFKNHAVSCNPINDKTPFFSSSSTTCQGASRHYLPDINLYHTAFTKSFEFQFGNIKDYTFRFLLPSYMERSGSSLVYMAEKLLKISGDNSCI